MALAGLALVVFGAYDSYLIRLPFRHKGKYNYGCGGKYNSFNKDVVDVVKTLILRRFCDENRSDINSHFTPIRSRVLDSGVILDAES